jgi:hypothetical protein
MISLDGKQNLEHINQNKCARPTSHERSQPRYSATMPNADYREHHTERRDRHKAILFLLAWAGLIGGIVLAAELAIGLAVFARGWSRWRLYRRDDLAGWRSAR